MAMREFSDAQGRTWEVWETYPSNDASALERYMQSQPTTPEGNRPTTVRDAFRDGWLTFSCGTERRRLMPIPKDWTEATVETLRSYWDIARIAEVRTRKP